MNIQMMKAEAQSNGLTKLSIIVDGDRTAIGNLVYDVNQKPHTLDIKPVSNKRTLTANAYYWELIGKLARVLRIGNQELHRNMLKEYGTQRLRSNGHPIVQTILTEIDVDAELPDIYLMPVKTSMMNGKSYTHYVVMKGSSEMNSAEFSRLLDGLIDECKAQKIETLTPIQIASLKAEMQRREHGN